MRFVKSTFIAAALAFGTLAAASIISTAPAQAHGFGGFGHWGHGFGHGWGRGFGRFGFGGYDDGGCYIKHWYDEDGDEHFRKVCY